jgi:hypothetical protein
MKSREYTNAKAGKKTSVPPGRTAIPSRRLPRENHGTHKACMRLFHDGRVKLRRRKEEDVGVCGLPHSVA